LTAPLIKVIILEPFVPPLAASRRLMAMFIAVPTHLAGLFPYSVGHGSA